MFAEHFYLRRRPSEKQKAQQSQISSVAISESTALWLPLDSRFESEPVLALLQN